MSFTDQQWNAITRSGQDVCVVAGPGSGKTSVLVERFCWLVKNGTSPLEILAITFTEKAATEIKRRLVNRFKDRPEFREQIERAYVSTIHGFCARLLREHAIAAGVDPEFTVLDEPQSKAALHEVTVEALEALFEEKPEEFSALLDALPSVDLAECLMRVYEAIRVAGASLGGQWGRSTTCHPGGQVMDLPHWGEFLDDVESVFRQEPLGWDREKRNYLAGLREWSRRVLALRGEPVSVAHFRLLGEFDCKLPKLKRGNAIYDGIKRIRDEGIPAIQAALAEEYFAPQHKFLVGMLGRIDQAYRAHKRTRGALDFSDLEECSVAFLGENEERRESIRSEFKAILMDELQDTNRLQWKLIEMIRSPEGFFAVGDINQSIYGFRHADPEIFHEYRNQVANGHDVDQLPHNHRSRDEILRAVDRILSGADGIESHELIAHKPFPAKPEHSVEVIGASTVDIEAQWVARRVREIQGRLMIGKPGEQRPAGFRDIAVLVRSMNAWTPLRKAFDEFGIPYLVSGGRTFYEAREVRDLTLWLQVVANPLDEISLAAVLRSPLVGIGDETLLRLKRTGSIWTALTELDRADTSAFHAADLERLRFFREQISRAREDRGAVSPDRLLARAIDECDYEGALNEAGRANVEKFLARLRVWFHDRPAPLAALLRELDWLRESESEPEAPPDDSSNAVRVMSIHGAKGLEFPVVFIPALHRGVNRSTPPICFHPVGQVHDLPSSVAGRGPAPLRASDGLGVEWRDPATGEEIGDRVYESFKDVLKDREAAEENRLLYVAMTRAEEHLVLSFTQVKSPGSKWAKRVAEGLDFNPERLHDAPPDKLLDVLPAEAQTVPELLAPPPVTDQHDSAATVTSISTFAACPRRYYLARYLGWEPEDDPRPDASGEDAPVARRPPASEFGSQVHAILAGEPVENPDPKAQELAARFHASPLGQRQARAGRLEREFDFLMDVEDVVLRGQIDLWFEEAGELILVDYKTDAVDAAEAAAHAAPYALQLHLYALALERLTGRRPNGAFLYMLRPDVVVPVALGDRELEAAKEAVRAFREAQATLKFPLHEGEQCWRCPFFHGLCPAGA